MSVPSAGCHLLASRDLGLTLVLGLSGVLLLPVLIRFRRISSRDVAVIAGLIGSVLATNYALVWLPNIKVMDLVVFASGYTFGAPVGVLVGALTWSVYGTLNPFGFDMPTWLVTMSSEAVYGVAGGFRGRLKGRFDLAGNARGRYTRNMFEMAFWAVTLTVIYDLATNIVPALVYDIPLLPYLMAAVPFMLLHVLGNTLFFSVIGVPLLKLLEGQASRYRLRLCDGQCRR